MPDPRAPTPMKAALTVSIGFTVNPLTDFWSGFRDRVGPLMAEARTSGMMGMLRPAIPSERRKSRLFMPYGSMARELFLLGFLQAFVAPATSVRGTGGNWNLMVYGIVKLLKI